MKIPTKLKSSIAPLDMSALAVYQAHPGLPVGFLLLRYSVLFTVLAVIFTLNDPQKKHCLGTVSKNI